MDEEGSGEGYIHLCASTVSLSDRLQGEYNFALRWPGRSSICSSPVSAFLSGFLYLIHCPSPYREKKVLFSVVSQAPWDRASTQIHICWMNVWFKCDEIPSPAPPPPSVSHQWISCWTQAVTFQREGATSRGISPAPASPPRLGRGVVIYTNANERFSDANEPFSLGGGQTGPLWRKGWRAMIVVPIGFHTGQPYLHHWVQNQSGNWKKDKSKEYLAWWLN